MLRMNRHFARGGVGSCYFSGLAPNSHGLLTWGNVCVASGGVGQVLSAIPDGYGVGNALYPPLIDGAMSAYTYDLASLSGTSSLISGGAVASGSTTVLVVPVADAGLGLNVLMAGTDTMGIAPGTPNLAMTLGLEGSYTAVFAFDTSILAIIDPITGAFTAALIGTADLRGKLSMAGEFSNSDSQVTVNYAGAIYVSEWGSDGYTYPSGTATQPVLTLACARSLCVKYNLRTIMLNGTHMLADDYEYYDFHGWGALAQCGVILNPSYTVNKTKFSALTVLGTLSTVFPDPPAFSAYLGTVQFNDCYLYAVKNLAGNMLRCQLSGAITINPSKWVSGQKIIIEGDTCTIDLQSTSGTTVSMDVDSGWCQFKNCDTGTLVELNVKGGEVSFLDSCTGGEYYLEGVGTLFMEGTGMTKKENHFIWNEPISYVDIETGSTAEKLSAAGSGGLSPTQSSQLEKASKALKLGEFVALK